MIKDRGIELDADQLTDVSGGVGETAPGTDQDSEERIRSNEDPMLAANRKGKPGKRTIQ